MFAFFCNALWLKQKYSRAIIRVYISKSIWLLYRCVFLCVSAMFTKICLVEILVYFTRKCGFCIQLLAGPWRKFGCKCLAYSLALWQGVVWDINIHLFAHSFCNVSLHWAHAFLNLAFLFNLWLSNSQISLLFLWFCLVFKNKTWVELASIPRV